MSDRLLAINLILSGRLCLIVGAGEEADQRSATLAGCGAKIRKTLPPVTEEDVIGARLVVCTLGDEEVHRHLRELTLRHGALLHCADDRAHSDFTMPAVLRRGALTVAVATGGQSPALSRQLRDELEPLLDERLSDFVDKLGELRRRLADLPSEDRIRRLREAVAGVRIEGELILP